MPKTVKLYKDPVKAAAYRKRHKLSNYAKGRIGTNSHNWTFTEDAMVLAHMISDSRLSRLIKHSVQSIQIRRWRLRKSK